MIILAMLLAAVGVVILLEWGVGAPPALSSGEVGLAPSTRSCGPILHLPWREVLRRPAALMLAGVGLPMVLGHYQVLGTVLLCTAAVLYLLPRQS